jgi:hypothetical protein
VEEYLETVVHQAMYVTIDKLCVPLLSILTKLAKYDVGDRFLHTIKMLVSSTVGCVFTKKLSYNNSSQETYKGRSL